MRDEKDTTQLEQFFLSSLIPYPSSLESTGGIIENDGEEES
jgi:hypothetical protein